MAGVVATKKTPLRVVSLLPSATENFAALLEFCQQRRLPQVDACACLSPSSQPPLPVLVARSHECDFPRTAAIQSLPVLTAARTTFTSSADTHNQVRQALAEASSLYHLDAETLVTLEPDVILTQSTCKVCSIDLATVESSLVGDNGTAGASASCSISGSNEVPEIPSIPGKTARIVTCNPKSLMQVLVDQFQQLGRELGVEEQGNALAQQHLEKLVELQQKAQQQGQLSGKKARVLMIEWLDPLFVGTVGWMRDIVEYAGGEVVESLDEFKCVGGDVGQVDVMVVALCGLSLEKTEEEIRNGRVGEWWDELREKQMDKYGRVPDLYLVDGTSMFTRPTRRLLLGLEWLVNILHDPQGEWLSTTTFPYKKFDFATTEKSSAADKNGSIMSLELLEIEELHKAACLKKEAMYKDPATGYSVLTAHFLQERQVCCGNCCRHCPYGHANVKDASRRKNVIAQDVFLNPRKKRSKAADAPGGYIMWPKGFEENIELIGSPRNLVVMFWSGGKDSFLALSHLYASYADAKSTKRMPQVVLLTTIDPGTNAVPVQNIDVQTIVAQAEALQLPLFLIAVGLGGGYAGKVEVALRELPGKVKRDAISTLVFGDLHLEDIRAWREQAFSKDYDLAFPVWKKDYKTELLPALEKLCEHTGASITYSTIDSQELKQRGWKAGDEYKWAEVAALNERESLAVDLMGESGEFHTCVKFPGMK